MAISRAQMRTQLKGGTMKKPTKKKPAAKKPAAKKPAAKKSAAKKPRTSAQIDAQRRYTATESRGRAGDAARRLAEQRGNTPADNYARRGR